MEYSCNEYDFAKFEDLIGKTIIEISGAEQHSHEIVFVTDTYDRYVMGHFQDCCECVYVEDVVGDVTDLIGARGVIVDAYASSNSGYDYHDNHETWTFYHIRSNLGSVTIRWYGTSNGYYSESVDFIKLKDDVS